MLINNEKFYERIRFYKHQYLQENFEKEIESGFIIMCFMDVVKKTFKSIFKYIQLKYIYNGEVRKNKLEEIGRET